MYTLEFMLQLFNLYAYYQAHAIATISDRYGESMVSFAITFIILVFTMNEERYAPAEPIIADTVS